MKNKKIRLGSNIVANKTKDLGHGIVEAIVSTESMDRHGEKINLKGINVKHYNGIVLWGHDYDALPIGKALSVRKKEDGLHVKFQFAVEEYPFSKTVYDLVKGGYLSDVSIGGIVDQWNDDYTEIEEMEMVEFSVVNIGANRDAKIISAALAKDFGKSTEDFKREYHEAQLKHLSKKFKNTDNKEIREYVTVLEKLTSVLKGEVDKPEETNESLKRVRLVKMQKTSAEADKTIEKIIKLVKVKKRETI